MGVEEEEPSKRRRVRGVGRNSWQETSETSQSRLEGETSQSRLEGETFRSRLEGEEKNMVGKLETGNDASEVFSPPRVAQMAHDVGMKGGWSLDITTQDERGIPWDFSNAEMRLKARRLVLQSKPTLRVGSPMCREWSVLRNISAARRDPEDVARKMVEARATLAFVMELYTMQSDQGRCWMREHPKAATSWKEPNVMELLPRSDSARVEGHVSVWHDQPGRARRGVSPKTDVFCDKLQSCGGEAGQEAH
jgi:hypothetical protein